MQILDEKESSTVLGYRLAPQQRQVSRQQPEAIAYGAQCVISVTGRLHTEALRTAIAGIVEQHEILRTSFQRQPGMRTPVQVIYEQPALSWREIDLVDYDAASQQCEIAAVREADGRARTQDRNNSGEVLRIAVLRLAAEDHLLVLTLPTLCADYTSLSLLTHEIARAYDECLNGEITPGESLQYADFCEWQNELAEGEDAEPGRAFWLNQPTTPLSVRLPFEAQSVSTGAPDRLSFTLDCLDHQELSPQTLLLACWQVLLRRLSGHESFYINCLFEGRHYDELNNAIGLFARSLPLFCRLRDEQTILSLGEEIEDRCSQMSEWQEYYESEATAQTDQIGFEYFERVDDYVSGSGLKWQVLDQRSEIQQAKLGLRCERVGDRVHAEISYDSQVYTGSDIEWLSERLRTIVTSAIGDVKQTVGGVTIVSQREWRYLVEELGQTEAQDLTVESIVVLFEAAAERYANRVAVVCGDEQLTYGELNGKANQVARYLRARGVGPDVNVALFMERRVNAFVALLAVLKAGGAFVPLNLEQPQDRVAHQLADMQAPFVLTEEKLRNQLPEFAGAVVCLDSDAASWQCEPEDNPAPSGFPENIAYIIYTSGSTGTPKGVAVTRQNLLNYTLYMCRRLQLELQTVSEPLSFATVSTLAADLGHTAIFPSLVTGGCLHVIDYDVVTHSERFSAYIEKHPIDVLKIVPSHLGALLSGRDVLPRRRLVTGGEALSHQLVDRLKQTSSTCRIINHYGPTETTVGCLTFDVDETPGIATATVPIGRPIANTRAYVVDPLGRLAPLGAAGELCISGTGVSRGYLNQPAQTAERFIPDAFSGKAGARLYRTGDLVRQLPNGAIEFLGRVDSQVKIRGHRIELGEIEVALRQHPEIREVVVVAASDEREHKRLVAYLVSSGKPAPTVSELQSFLKTKLPAYMWPSIFVLLDELPLTPNGKVDRRALPAPEAARIAPEARSIEAPRSEVETTLTEIWKQVLGIAEVGIHDNFFELGGDSIISIQIIARANQRGIRLTPKQLFQNQTIAQLAAVANTTGAPLEAEQGIVTGPLPLTPVQQWFFEQEISEPHHWNQSLLLELKQPVDPRLLEKAVEHLFKHHDALRLRFTKAESGWQQDNAAPGARVPFEYVDLSTLPPAEQSSTIEQRAAETQTRIDLAEGSLIRVVLFDCGVDQPGRLLLVIHHLAVDGVSWRVLLGDLQTAYNQLARGEDVQLARKTTSFKRWAHQLAEHAQSSETRAELPFWLEQIHSATQLPRDKEDGENTVASSETFIAELSADETRALLRDVPAKFRTHINDALLAALAQGLATWTNAAPSVVELEGHGREELDEETDVSLTVGWFTTHYPVVLDLEGADTPGESLQFVKEQLRRVPRNGIGYGLLRYLSAEGAIVDQLRAASKPEVSFNYLGQIDQTLPESAMFTVASEDPGPSRSLAAKRPFLLEVGGSVTGGKLMMNWTYSRNVHARETIERLAENFNRALRALIAYAATEGAASLTPSDFPLARLDQSELDALTRDVPHVEDIYPLSPVQQGLLFHSLYAPEGGLYFEQKTCLLRGKLDTNAFRKACEEVVNRHAILRTAFRWQDLDEPLQVIHNKVDVPWIELDWRVLNAREQQQRLEQFFRDDRAKAFEPAVAPLMRMALIKIDDQTHRFTWSHHHLLLDGWTMPILFGEVYVCYEAFRQGRTPNLQQVRPYRDYIEWLQQQDMSEAERYWREALRGLKGPSSIPRKQGATHKTAAAEIYEHEELQLSVETSAGVRAFVRQHQLTINTLVQGMWAILLSHHSRSADVVFGATVSGRPPSLKGVEHMVGLFINTLPVRVRVRSGETMLAWLKELQEQQVEMRQYEYTPLVKLQEWSEVSRDVPLFDHILVFDNYPIANTAASLEAPPPEETFTFEEFEAFEKTNYAILVQAGMGEQLTFRILHDRELIEKATVARILRHFEILIESVMDQPAATLKTMLDVLSDFDSEQEAAKRETRLAAKFKKFGQVQPKVITAATPTEV